MRSYFPKASPLGEKLSAKRIDEGESLSYLFIMGRQ